MGNFYFTLSNQAIFDCSRFELISFMAVIFFTAFLHSYFSGDAKKVNQLGEQFQKFCLQGPGEGCGVTRELLRGGHYEGCMGGVGEGCGQGTRKRQ
jgi:hypothetical protein